MSVTELAHPATTGAADAVADDDFAVVALEHPDGVLSLVAFRRMPLSQQRLYIRQLLATFSGERRPRAVDVPTSGLSPEVVHRIQQSFADRGGDMVVCPARRGSTAPAAPSR